MASGHAHLDGAAELRRALARLHGLFEVVGVDALNEWSDDVRGDARATVPIRTGNLGSAIEARVDKKELRAEVGVWEDDARYSIYVEQGTSSMEAQPFLEPAFEAHRNIRPYVRDALKRHL